MGAPREMADDYWWKTGIVYQIYPLSYMDANGDGKGDLPGITSRLDYLKDLGVDAVWISPIYPSPFKDFGYDVADYVGINPTFGTMDDFDELLAGIHSRGMKLILDFVPNHSSDEHPWFVESRSSKDNPKRDWYIWRDPAPDGGPPNNWQANFGGSAWTLDETTGQYYLHLFDPGQPDLNWRNPDVEKEMLGAIDFWMARGVDGFRVDVIGMMIKDDHFLDEPDNPKWKPGMHSYARHKHIYTIHQPGTFDIVRKMRDVLEAHDDQRVLIGEVFPPFREMAKYYCDGAGCHLPFNFSLIFSDFAPETIATLIGKYLDSLPDGNWPNFVLGNHDQPRLATRVGAERAPLAAMLLLTLQGTPTIYYGEELGMEDAVLDARYVNDPAATDGESQLKGRDPCRTPMQWDTGAHAGFTEGDPWLPVSPDWQNRNVESQGADENSLLSLYKRLIALRRTEPALHRGTMSNPKADGDLLAWTRAGGEVTIALNFGADPLSIAQDGDLLLSTDHQRCDFDGTLAPYEGVILRTNS